MQSLIKIIGLWLALAMLNGAVATESYPLKAEDAPIGNSISHFYLQVE